MRYLILLCIAVALIGSVITADPNESELGKKLQENYEDYLCEVAKAKGKPNEDDLIEAALDKKIKCDKHTHWSACRRRSWETFEKDNANSNGNNDALRKAHDRKKQRDKNCDENNLDVKDMPVCPRCEEFITANASVYTSTPQYETTST